MQGGMQGSMTGVGGIPGSLGSLGSRLAWLN